MRERHELVFHGRRIKELNFTANQNRQRRSADILSARRCRSGPRLRTLTSAMPMQKTDRMSALLLKNFKHTKGCRLLSIELNVVMHSAGQLARSPAAKIVFACAGLLIWFSLACALHSADLEEVRKQFLSGQYSNCIRACEQAIADREYSEEWRLLLVQSLMATGRYTNALGV